jgi:hypothetical protein
MVYLSRRYLGVSRAFLGALYSQWVAHRNGGRGIGAQVIIGMKPLDVLGSLLYTQVHLLLSCTAMGGSA